MRNSNGEISRKMQDVTVPPVNTNPIGTAPVTFDMGQAAGLMIGLFLVLIVVYWYYMRSNRVTGTDVRPKIEDMIYAGWSPNKMMAIQIMVIFPATFGMIFGLLFMAYDFIFGLIIVCLVGFGTAAPYFYIKDRVREKNRNNFKLDGYLWLKSGKRIKYTFLNVAFGTEIMLTNDEVNLLYDENPDWDRKDQIVEKARVIPTLIDDKYMIYIIMTQPVSETMEWVDDEDFDYFGTLTVKSDGPEMKEIATLHRVRADDDDEDYSVNEYIPTLLVLWDAFKAKQTIKNIPTVDVTTNTVLAGLTKQIGAETRYTAGELNSKEAALRSKNKGQSLMDDLGESLGRKKAMEYLKNETRLTQFDLMTNKTLWYVIGAVVMGIVVALVAYNAGYAQAILELLRGV